MTISQVIQTISLGNFTYFTVLHAYFFPNISPQLRQCRSGSATMLCWPGAQWHWADRLGLDWIGHGLNWHGAHWHESHWLGCTGSGCIALDHFVSLKRFTQNKKLRTSKNPFYFQAPLLPRTATRNQKNESGEKNSLTRY